MENNETTLNNLILPLERKCPISNSSDIDRILNIYLLPTKISSILILERKTAYLRYSCVYTQKSGDESVKEQINNESKIISFIMFMQGTKLTIQNTFKGFLLSILTSNNETINKISKYFQDKLNADTGMDELLLFSHLSFPQIFNGFITTETTEAAANIILKIANKAPKELFLNMISAYFDYFPEFSDNLWYTFQKKILDGKTNICSFIESIHESWYFLTEYHTNLIKNLRKDHRTLVVEFFFSYYFPKQFNTRLIPTNLDFALNSIFEDFLGILTFISQNPDAALADFIMDEMVSDYYNEIRAIHMFPLYTSTSYYQVYVSYPEMALLFDIFATTKNPDENKTNLNHNINDASGKNTIEISLSIPSQFKKKVSTKSSIKLFDSIQVDTFTLDEEEKAIINAKYNQIKNIANMQTQSLYDILTIKQNTQIENKLEEIITSCPKLLQYIKYQNEKYASDIYNKLTSMISNSFLAERLDAISNIFHSDLITLLSIFCNSYCQINCVKDALNVVTDQSLSYNNENTSILFYTKNIQLEVIKPRKLIAMNISILMNNTCIDADIRKHCNILSNNDFRFRMIISLIDAWSQSKIAQINFGDLISCFNDQLRFTILNNESFQTVLTKHTEYVRDKIRYISNLKLGCKIIEIVDLILGIEDYQQSDFVQLLTTALITSGNEDFLLPMLWYTRILLIFPDFVKDKWRESFNAINYVKDVFLSKMNKFNRKLMEFVNQYFFFSTSPLFQ